jgi:putative ABC transport system ATP-binding protein
MNTKVIECKDIKKDYDNGGHITKVLKGIDFAIEKGEFVAIMGPSGSGKSTLMNILGALDTPTSGGYFIDGKDVSKMDEDELARVRRKTIGFVFQSFNLLPRINVIKNVMMPLIYSKTPRGKRLAIVEAALRATSLAEDRWHHLSNHLSGGQMQRVAISRALVNDPSIILADEPTGNLDSKTGEVVLNTFQRLNDNGQTIILITHEEYIAKHADRIIILKDGLILSDEKNVEKLFSTTTEAD